MPQVIDHITEQFTTEGLRVDRENGVIRGVKLCGLKSKNKRDYPDAVLREATERYSGAMVNLDHPEKASDPRSVRDRFGIVENVSHKAGEGLYGDVKYNAAHPYADAVLWAAENSPRTMGMSHNALVKTAPRRQQGREQVESVVRVQSMDLVADPATTRGLFEHVDPPEPEESEMKMEELTLEQLQKDRPDLLQAITEAQDQESETAELKQRLEALEKEKADLEKEKAATEHAAKIDAEIKESKKEVSDECRDALLALESEEARKAVLESIGGTEKKKGTKAKTEPVKEGRKQTADSLLEAIA